MITGLTGLPSEPFNRLPNKIVGILPQPYTALQKKDHTLVKGTRSKQTLRRKLTSRAFFPHRSSLLDILSFFLLWFIQPPSVVPVQLDEPAIGAVQPTFFNSSFFLVDNSEQFDFHLVPTARFARVLPRHLGQTVALPLGTALLRLMFVFSIPLYYHLI